MQKFFSEFKQLDKETYRIMKYGLLFSGIVCLAAVGVLLFYIFLEALSLLKSSFTFAVEFIVCGIIVDFIKNKGI